MKVLILLTGGTIGSTTKDGITAPDPAAVSDLLRYCGDDVTCEIRTPYYILSEMLCASHLNLLSQAVLEGLAGGFDGLIITHGSDTLHYTAAILDTMFSDAKVPIVLVCSNYPLSDPRSNGAANFKAALAWIKKSAAVGGTGNAGVFAAYRNDPQDETHGAVIYRARCLLRSAEASGNLSCCDEKSGIADASVPARGRAELCSDPGILPVTCAPGVLYPAIDSRIRAVILLPYHSGTLPVNDPALQTFCSACREKEIPLLVPAPDAQTRYASSGAFEELGITKSPLPYAALYADLWISISSCR